MTREGSAFGFVEERISSDDLVENVQALWKIASQEKAADEGEPDSADSAGAAGVDGSTGVSAPV
jgi:hypothetical protein